MSLGSCRKFPPPPAGAAPTARKFTWGWSFHRHGHNPLTWRLLSDPQEEGEEQQQKGSIVTEDSTANPPSVILSLIPNISLKVYEFHQLNQATKGFSTERRIEGSSVYRAELSGSPAAVKRMNRDVSGEINILMKINHFNIISLSGFCSHLGTCYLVYEYMENGSLRDWIIHKDRSKVLPWIQRIKIALDVAIGLEHLHGYTEPPCVHKDVKSSNILLDGDFRAKVANLGLFRPAAGGGEFPPTRHIVGTVGYMAPEYAEHGFISPSIDVYSFGVVMMELVTGRDAATAAPGGEESFAAALTSFLGGGGGDPPEEMRSFVLAMARLVNTCLEDDPARRPDMGKVARVLSVILTESLTWAAARPENPLKI
ncbi:unnamed protein product [Spirodela intermedia]|uniref:Protein kinase domain-containing protein n=1 Tax=Spirodela intermedia TaxID=51605 RepID=A0A7I8JBD3_SPIIN|nr:unnamed protein product [Spirodela intermedia]CAA6667477.1 unnamed protein product [Spirodela intermedia]